MKDNEKNESSAGFVIAILLIGFLYVFLFKLLSRPKEFGPTPQLCSVNLKSIGTAITNYMNDNKGQAPPDLHILIKECDLQEKYLYCVESDFENPIFYHYRGDDLDDSCSSSMIMAYDPIVHKGNNVNILFADSRLRVVTYEDFERSKIGLEQKPSLLKMTESGFKPQKKHYCWCSDFIGCFSRSFSVA